MASQSDSTITLDKTSPKSFYVTSGELLWGQYQCLLEGSRSTSHDGPSKIGQPRQGGTIIQNDWHYRLAARKGKWIVSKLSIDQNPVGYIIHHDTADPIEYAKMASNMGISNGNKNGNTKMIYINRYDWGGHHNDSKEFEKAAANASTTKKPKKSEKDDEDDESKYQLVASCCVFLDARYFDSLLKFYGDLVVKDKDAFPPKRESFSFVSSEKDHEVGVHLTEKRSIEYELGWIGFSGKKHPDFPDSDECVAFVYDTAYSALELTGDQKLYVGDQVAKSANE